MKKYIITIFYCVLCVGSTLAQNNVGKADDAARIVLKVWIPKQIDEMPPAAHSNLKNKLAQIVTKNDASGNSIDGRFIITSNVTVLTKDITPTNPPMQAYTLQITFYVGDGIDGTLFESCAVTTRGVGENALKAYTKALNNINENDPAFKNLIESGKTHIMQYYNSQVDFIIKEAETLATQQEYEKAIAKLVAVPSVCKDAYDQCMDACKSIYQQKINRDGAVLLREAQGIWNAGQDVAAARQAIDILNGIDPNADCKNEIALLIEEIGKRVQELDQREWNNMQQQQERTYDLEKRSIQAMHDVGVAYAENQQPTIYYTPWW